MFATCYFLAYSSLKPIRDIVGQAGRITAQHIDRRLPVKNERDELGELSMTFNALLERLEVSFNAQKMFVSNVSHEMRTRLLHSWLSWICHCRKNVQTSNIKWLSKMPCRMHNG